MNNDGPQRHVYINYIEVHTDEDLVIFDKAESYGCSFHDDCVHVSYMFNGEGVNYFFPLTRVAKLVIKEQGLALVPRGVDLLSNG